MVRRRLLPVALAIVAALALSASAQAQSLGCGLPDASPLWAEFSDGSVEFRQQLFGKPGIVVATNGEARAAEMRALGAHTVYWHMNLRGVAGTPTVPNAPELVEQRAAELLVKARAATGCDTPVIALNELNGVSRATPWPPEVVQYRENVLTALRRLSEGGARPMLLVPGQARGSRAPYVGDFAADWWKQVGQVAHVVRQMHFNAPYIYARGPVVGARMRRDAMRDALRPFLDLGIPAERLGLLLGFQSGPGKGGREGLTPSAAWFEIVKQDALAAKQVAAELGIATIWSWGWGTFTFAPEGADPDKAAAACVYLWARDPSLCDGPAAAGPGFNASTTIGQIILPAGAQCSVGGSTIGSDAFEQAATLTGGDRLSALRGLLQRVALQRRGDEVTAADARAAERALVSFAFEGNESAYQQELAAAGVDQAAMRRVLADELRRQVAVARERLSNPSLNELGFLRRLQKEALRETICLSDEVPTSGDFNWGSYLPFLALPEPELSVEAPRKAVKRGATVTVTGTATSVLASEVVTAYALVGGRWTKAADARVAGDGSFELALTPTATTAYRLASRSAVAAPVTIRVKGKGR